MKILCWEMTGEGNEDLHVERTCVGIAERKVSVHSRERGQPGAKPLQAQYGSSNLSSLPDHN